MLIVVYFCVTSFPHVCPAKDNKHLSSHIVSLGKDLGMLDWVSPAQEPLRVAFGLSSGMPLSERLGWARGIHFPAATPTAGKLMLLSRKRLPLSPRQRNPFYWLSA